MQIGVVKEIKQAERRVALTPAGTRELVALGHDVLVESGAGIGSRFPDDAYAVSGARLFADAAEVWRESELLLKVKEPIEPEYPLHAFGSEALHLPASGAQPAAHRGAR